MVQSDVEDSGRNAQVLSKFAGFDFVEKPKWGGGGGGVKTKRNEPENTM